MGDKKVQGTIDGIAANCSGSGNSEGSADVLAEYRRYIDEAVAFFDNFDPRSYDPLKPCREAKDRILQKYAGVSYEEFFRRANPGDMADEEFSILPPGGLRKRLFDYRASVHLLALDSFEQGGGDVRRLLPLIRDKVFLPVKKAELEPVFEKMFVYMQGRVTPSS